jgi:hypothetical protein
VIVVRSADHRLTFSITNKAIDEHLETIVDELKKAEELSR